MVFVSHSSSKDDFAARVREAVCSSLREKGYRVFVDMDELRGGEEWSAIINQRLHECHAAVVLLNKKAFGSSWVRREVNILLSRRQIGFPIQIVPAFVGDASASLVDGAELKELTRLHAVRCGIEENDATAEALARTITARFVDLGPTPDDSPMRRWIDRIAHCLTHTSQVDALVDAARHLGVGDSELTQVRLYDGPTFLARQFVTHWQSSRLPIENDLYCAVDRIAGFTDMEWLRRLIREVTPTWVDLESARQLLVGPDGPALVTLSAADPDTARHYVARATCLARTYRYVKVSIRTGTDLIGEFLRECEKAVRTLTRADPRSTLAMTPEQHRGKFFLIVDPETTPMERALQAVRAVQQRYSWLVVLLMTKGTQATDDEIERWGIRDALVLPALSAEDEDTGREVVSLLVELPDIYLGATDEAT